MQQTEKKPELSWIKITSLYVPSEYQRSVKSDASQKNISKIKNDFNWAECGALVVCPLKGSRPPQYAIIDGQHRYNAALLHGKIDELPCVVIESKEVADQAKSFISINENRVGMHILHKYQAMIVSGHPDAIALDGVLKKCKIGVASCAFSGGKTPPRITMAIGTLLKMMSNTSEKQITWALTIIPEAYEEKQGMLTANLINVMVRFIKENPVANRDAMVAVLRRLDMETLRNDAMAYRKIEGVSTVTAMLKVIEKKYTSKLKGAL